MAQWEFTESADDGHGAIAVYVRNPDAVTVGMVYAGDDRPTSGIRLSYWQLERIVRKVRAEFAFQLDREQAEHGITSPDYTAAMQIVLAEEAKWLAAYPPDTEP